MLRSVQCNLDLTGQKQVFKAENNPWVTPIADQFQLGVSHVFEYIRSETYKYASGSQSVGPYQYIWNPVCVSLPVHLEPNLCALTNASGTQSVGPYQYIWNPVCVRLPVHLVFNLFALTSASALNILSVENKNSGACRSSDTEDLSAYAKG
ncbi:hypothetical protein STEG23_019743, partial [Scotinomys teguina]